MAASKGTHPRKKRPRQFLHFPQVKGKIIENVEIDPDVTAIVIFFQDKTALSFDLDPQVAVFPELADWKTGNWRGIRGWPRWQSKPSVEKWPYTKTKIKRS